MLLNPMPYFQKLKDPRRETKNKLHRLGDILMIVLCAALSVIADWLGMEEFAKEKRTQSREFLELPNDIPSLDMSRDALGRIDPQGFQEAFCVGFKRLCRVYQANKSVWTARYCA